MGGGKETPRQKLIGLMYLVLMALLAMNVSKSILNAFIIVNDKFEHAANLTHKTTEAMMEKMNQSIVVMKSSGAAQKEIDDIETIIKSANEIRELSRTTSNFFVWEASDMVHHSDPIMPAPFYTEEGSPEKPYYVLMQMDTLSKKDDYDTAPHMYLLEGVLEPSERGINIEDRLFSFRDSIITMAAKYSVENGEGGSTDYFIDPTILVRPPNSHDTTDFEESIATALKTVHPNDQARIKRIIEVLTVPEVIGNHGESYPWVAYQFDHTVIVAAATIFTALKNDVKMAEQLAIEVVSGRATVESFSFNKIIPLAFSKSSYINQGDSLDLKIMIAAFDSTEAMNLEYYVDDTSHTGDPLVFSGEPGDALTLSGGVGTHFVEGTIEVKEKGAVKKKPWKFNYSVGAPTATVANADLAVLYKGWDNKLKISASGYEPEAIKISCSGCSISKKGDFYIAKPGNGKIATVSVSATTEDGKTVKLAAEEFRIFPLPLPKPYFANQTFDKPTIKKGSAISASQVLAKLGDSPLNVKYTVTGFKMIVSKGGKIAELKAKNGKLTKAMRDAIKKMPKGTSLTFIGVSAAGPSGKSAPIGGLSFKLI
ncbi:MAG: GldM family protein [Flavobacteriales bacterium]|nr:GldM family protein [Flavobacteriales bacterium]